MRFKAIFKLKEKKIPISNRFMIVSLIKKAIELGDENLFEELYFYQGKKNKKTKSFTFAIYLNDFNIKDEYIELNGDLSITISTSDYNIGIGIYNGLLKLKDNEFKYKKYTLVMKKIILLKEKKVKEEEIVCKTLSPIYIRDIDGNPIEVENENFEKGLNYISDVFLKSYRGYGLKKELKFQKVKMKKQVVKEEIECFINKTHKKYMFINCYSGIFKLEGDIEDLNLLLQNGLGYRRNQGFGTIDLI